MVWCLKTHLGEMLLWICCEFRLPAQNEKQNLREKCLGDILGCTYELVGAENLLEARGFTSSDDDLQLVSAVIRRLLLITQAGYKH